ncbi:unnamed protein product [Trifolium pratense]|uniref:Uncharacterized protein n=1 Tax=Trifolium pratense TaxID=57577 RepID=A0ACB0KA06_TRIPR|nr:unnamed protein product [Trifolium pratense]
MDLDPTNSSHVAKMFMDFMNDGTEEKLLRLYIEQAQEEAAADSSSRRRRRRRKIERNYDAGHDSNSTKQDDVELDPKSRDSDVREDKRQSRLEIGDTESSTNIEHHGNRKDRRSRKHTEEDESVPRSREDHDRKQDKRSGYDSDRREEKRSGFSGFVMDKNECWSKSSDMKCCSFHVIFS